MEPFPLLAGNQCSSGKTLSLFFLFFYFFLLISWGPFPSGMPISINISFKTNVIICLVLVAFCF